MAKQKPGGLDGEVVNAKGAPVAGAQILWQAADGETPHVLHSDAQGRFHIEQLRTGFYDLRASAGGTWSEWEHNVLVRPGDDANVTLRLTFKAPPAAAGRRIERRDARVGCAGFGSDAARFRGRFERQHLVHAAGDGTHRAVQSGHARMETVQGADAGLRPARPGFRRVRRYLVHGKLCRKNRPAGPEVRRDRGIHSSHGERSAHAGVWTGRRAVVHGAEFERDRPAGHRDRKNHRVRRADAGRASLRNRFGGRWRSLVLRIVGRKAGPRRSDGGAITEYAPAETDVEPRRLVAVSGAIYFTDSGGGRLGRLTLADKKFKLWDSPSGNHSEPYGIAADSAGKIWYEESGTDANKLVRFDPAVEVFRTYPMPAPNSSVRNMARDAKGRLWLPLSLANKIAVVE